MKPGVVSLEQWRPKPRPEEPEVREKPAWGMPVLAGRLAELSARGASSQLSLAFGAVADAQRRGEPAAWITNRASTFFPPDAAANGIALDALPVVFVPDAASAARAADKLVRSGAFGVVVLDLVANSFGAPAADPPRTGRARNANVVPAPLMSRLVGLAQQHEAAVLFLTEKPAEEPSLGALVSLRCEAAREPFGGDRSGDRFLCLSRAVKDKRNGPGWTFSEVRRGPVGMR